jgi:methionyl-tRNA formyltransferase
LINERTKIKGWSPLIIALYNNYHEIVKLLLENGADYNLCNYNGTTPLMYAKDGWINSNNSSSFDLLLRYGVDVYIVDYNNKNLLDYLKHKDSGYYNIAIKKINERQ